MNCVNHPTAEAVTTCGWCDAPMCEECVEKSFITRKINNRPTCYACSCKHVEDDAKWLIRCKIALIVGGISWLAIIILAMFEAYYVPMALMFVVGFFLSTLSTMAEDIANDEAANDPSLFAGIKCFFKKIIYKIILIIVFTLISPIALLVYWIIYLRKKKRCKYDSKYIQEYASIMPENADKIYSTDPLFSAIIDNDKDKVLHLIEKGKNVNKEIPMTVRGNTIPLTPLVFALDQEKMDIASLLIEKGADVNYKNTEGESLLDIAIKSDNQNMIDFLKGHGAQ